MSAQDRIAQLSAAVEGALRAAVESRADHLYRMMEYQLGWVGEQGAPRTLVPMRPRAALCLAACEAVGGPSTGSGRAAALPAAAAVELLHEFTRVHEGVQSGSPEQDGRPNGWWLWGPAQAINVGDALHMVARLTLLHAEGIDPERVLEAAMVMDAAALEMFEGQEQDIRLQLDPAARPHQYMEMCERRTGALLGCALQLGALAAGADASVQDALRTAGRHLGVEMQLRDDINAVWAEEGQDPAAVVRRSFPVLTAIEGGPVSVKREIGTLLMARSRGPNEAARMTELLDDVGAVQATVVAAGIKRRECLDALGRAGLSDEGLADIAAMVGYLTGVDDPPF